MDQISTDIGFDLPTGSEVMGISVRLLAAVILAALVGFERGKHGRAAGLRTHMMVALGAALFTIVPIDAGANAGDMTRIVQGIAAGVGFLGAGAILKMTSEKDIMGLTTASSIWLTAAIGMAAGAGQLWSALFSTILALIILTYLRRLERLANPKKPNPATGTQSESHQ